ncbi:hypothetical protein [Cryobacterium sp. Y57]|uniref:hypothetical protein n=1 Tax=Cryobacterium sp. Y57 TaxID=2048287 RepID=UPI0018EB6DFD|nr:hypothetical protein [Cryobacterium sp. Y57]
MARELRPCGTFAAYQRHLRKKEPICDLCAEAAREQKNTRVDTGRAESASLVALALAAEPAPDVLDELDEARENLRAVKAAMSEAPANAVAALSKRREELVRRIVVLSKSNEPEESVFDQLRKRREERIAASSH